MPLLHGSDQCVALPDGRYLGFQEHGERHGAPVFYFHGFPGSRLEAGFFPVRGLRLIAVDRPGYGLSTPQRGRRLADWPDDISHLADALGLERFAVLGISGGAPYAAACAGTFSGRLAAAALVCGLGPPEAPGMQSGRLKVLASLGRRPLLAGPLTALARRIVLSPRAEQGIVKARARAGQSRTEGVPKERAALTEEFVRFMLSSWREGVRHGSQGVMSDARIYGQPWPFPLESLRTPIHLWHGTDDRVVPVSIARHYAAHVPGIHARFCEGDGHFSVISNALNEIVDTLKAALRP